MSQTFLSGHSPQTFNKVRNHQSVTLASVERFICVYQSVFQINMHVFLSLCKEWSPSESCFYFLQSSHRFLNRFPNGSNTFCFWFTLFCLSRKTISRPSNVSLDSFYIKFYVRCSFVHRPDTTVPFTCDNHPDKLYLIWTQCAPFFMSSNLWYRLMKAS
jgi:hypothetical protein